MAVLTAADYDTTGKLDRVNELITGWIETDELPGAALAVAVAGEQVAELHFGAAAEGVAASADTIWPLASITKLYTAAMIMALVDRSELTLGYPVQEILPEFSSGGRENVTLRHLLTHTSGLIYESPVHEQRLKAETPYADLIDEAYLYPLMFQPGERLSYSDYGLALAARVAEHVTGKEYPELVRELVTDPASLANTYMRPPEGAYQRLAHVIGCQAYGTSGDMYNSTYGRNLAHPAFGAFTSVSDLLHFALLFTPHSKTRIHSRAAVRAMTQDQTGGNVSGSFAGIPGPANSIQWGLGFSLSAPGGRSPELLPANCYGHGGATGCTLWINPLDDIVIAYVSNKHAGTGRTPFTRRLTLVTNGVMTALTQD